ncbi:MAG: c-type cytochrome [bacterium]
MRIISKFTPFFLLLIALGACSSEKDGQATSQPAPSAIPTQQKEVTKAPQLTTEERLAQPADLDNGAKQFRQCAACHEQVKDAKHRIGPTLWGIVGQKSAHYPDFNYSAAMQRANVTWDETTLDNYLKNPQKFVPGNRMAFAGIRNDADRRDLIAYLESLSDNSAAPDLE